ncbi:NUMOD3 domain-containing DNA-binding protein [Sphingobium sp. WTD-1]|uniref:NUMOD3 domain-containing DNA-binding protein n=1 Tax=Sphingobium sp. WTD-1 TaxID=2979467 RepID=UPI0024DE544D|nr:NUMOD3 domain-containing DNA-binding protein [Sphingobium sp. WTD-1]WIA55170.1 NUMOD3 domain-containing DNA-binding protein [Sphingobium sp. WTD-1]
MHIYTQPYTYIIGWSEQKKYYIGQRHAKGCNPAELWVSYFTSGKLIPDFRDKHGEPDIVVTYLRHDKEDALWVEEMMMFYSGAVSSDRFLNLQSAGRHFSTKLGSKKPPRSTAHCNALAAANKGRKHSEETRRKISEAGKRRRHSAQTIEKLKLPKTDAHKEAIRKARLGTVFSEESRRKMSESAKRRWKKSAD